MNVLKMEKKIQVLNCLIEGCSIRSTERMTGCHRDTITRLLIEVGNKCQTIMAAHVKDFHSKFIEVDEIWTFCKKKEKRCNTKNLNSNRTVEIGNSCSQSS